MVVSLGCMILGELVGETLWGYPAQYIQIRIEKMASKKAIFLIQSVIEQRMS